MLAFYRPIQMEERTVGYRDHQSTGRLYLLPQGLSVVRDAGGQPAFSLLGYAGDRSEGWRFTLGLAMAVDTDSWETDSEGRRTGVAASPIPIRQASMRLKMVVPVEEGRREHFTAWTAADTAGHRIGTVALELEKNQGLILKDLLNAADLPVDALTAEIQIEYQGLRPMYPVHFAFSPRQFEEKMKAEIKNMLEDPVDDDFRVHEHALSEDAALALNRQWVESCGPECFSPVRSHPDADLTAELALRLLEDGWQAAGESRVTLRPLTQWPALAALADDPQKLSSAEVTWDLRMPKVGQACWIGQWRVAEFWKTLSPEEKSELFAMVPVAEPLKPVPIHITRTVPLDGHQIRKIVVKLHYFGTSLDWEDHEVVFDRGDQVFRTSWAILPRQERFYFYYAIQAFFGIPEGGGWPPPDIRLDTRRSESAHLPLNPATLGLVFLKLEAQADAFENVGPIEVRIFCRKEPTEENDAPELVREQTVRLTPAERERFALVRKISDTRRRFYRIFVHPPQTVDAEPIGTVELTELPQKRLLITAYHTQVVQPEIVTFRLESSEQFPAVTVMLRVKAVSAPSDAEGELLMLDAAEPEGRWSFWPPSIFVEPAYLWKAEVRFAEESENAPVVLDWRKSSRREHAFAEFGDIRG